MTNLFNNVDLRFLLSLSYKPEGIELWLKDAEKKDLTLDEAMERARSMAHGIQ